MNANNLKEGMIIKNYKELCVLIGEPVKFGNSKKSQIKELERYCEFHKEGNKFVIDEIYCEIKPKTDKRSEGNNSIYSDDVQELILYMLNNKEDNEICVSCSTLLQELSIVNSKYNSCRKNIDRFSESIDVEQFHIYDFYNNTHSSLRTKVETALNSLNRKSLLTWKKVIKVQKNEVSIKLNDTGTPLIINGKVEYTTSKTYSKATNNEERLIIKTERDVLLKMGYKDKRDVFLNHKYQQFKDGVNEILLKKANISFYYNAYEILFNPEHIKSLIVGEFGIELVKKDLNKNIIHQLNNSAITRNEKAKNQLKINKTKSNKLIASDEYLKNHNKITDELILLK